MRDFDLEIAEAKDELEHIEGTECEVYTRIVGYYRPVKNWNPGKKDEYNQRKLYKAEVCAKA